jgi:hypothetical protein
MRFLLSHAALFYITCKYLKREEARIKQRKVKTRPGMNGAADSIQLHV